MSRPQHCPACRVEYVARAVVCADCGGPLRPGRTPPLDDRSVPFEDPAEVAAIVAANEARRGRPDWRLATVAVTMGLGVLLLLCAPFLPSGPLFEAAEARTVARGLGWMLVAFGAVVGVFALQIRQGPLSPDEPPN